MHQQNFATHPRDRPTTSEEAWRFNENFHTTGRQSTAPNGQNKPLHLGSSSGNTVDLPIWEADVSSNHWRRFLATGYWSRRPTRCPRLTLEHRWRHREWGRGQRVWDNGDTVSSLMSPGSPYTTLMVGSGCAVGKGRGWLMPAPSLMTEILARQS